MGSDSSATDIITYVGIPLAVLGVLPTLSTSVRSVFTQRAVNRTLAHNGIMDAITRSSLLSGIIEIELPRKSIIPLDRSDPRYWEVNGRASTLRGGSWTIFKWKEMNIGLKSYRIQYHDELAQPQAEIEFEALIAFLLDRGAVPCVAGFADLKSSGLWTPAGTRLLLAPNTTDGVLMIAKSDDSDGILSLSLNWKSAWDRRWNETLPPYWIRLRSGRPMRRKKISEKSEDAKDEKKEDTDTSIGDVDEASSDYTADSPLASPSPVRIRVIASGVEQAHYEDSPKAAIHLPFYHRNASSEMPSACLWFNTALTSLAARTSGLWSFIIPPSTLSFCTRDSVPVGVLVILDIIPDNPEPSAPATSSSTTDQAATPAPFTPTIPQWRSHDPDSELSEEQEQFERTQRLMNNHRAISREMHMDPAAAMESRMARQREDMAQMQREVMQRRIKEDRKREREINDALASTRLSPAAVGGMAMQWLVREGNVDAGVGMTLQGVVESVAYEMVVDEGKAGRIADLLEMWRGWSESGGLARSHLDRLRLEREAFCQAACIVALVRESCAVPAGSVASDLQECLRVWKKVRLG